MDQFKKRKEFQYSLEFVSSLKDIFSSGFSDTEEGNSTLEATFYAVQLLHFNETAGTHK